MGQTICPSCVVEQATLTAVSEEGEILRADVPAMVISCTCDVQPKQGKFALLAPVIDLEFYKENSELQDEALQNHMQGLMDNKIANLFFLPAGQKLKASVIDFQQLTAVSVELLQKISSRPDLRHCHKRATTYS